MAYVMNNLRLQTSQPLFKARQRAAPAPAPLLSLPPIGGPDEEAGAAARLRRHTAALESWLPSRVRTGARPARRQSRTRCASAWPPFTAASSAAPGTARPHIPNEFGQANTGGAVCRLLHWAIWGSHTDYFALSQRATLGSQTQPLHTPSCQFFPSVSQS